MLCIHAHLHVYTLFPSSYYAYVPTHVRVRVRVCICTSICAHVCVCVFVYVRAWQGKPIECILNALAGENMIECLSAFEDAEEEKQVAHLMSQPLSHASVGLTDGTIVEISDDSQGDVKMKLCIIHWSPPLLPVHAPCLASRYAHQNVASLRAGVLGFSKPIFGAKNTIFLKKLT